MSRLTLPLLAFVLVTTSGCAAPFLTVAAGPAFSALQVLMVRSVEQTMPADIDTTRMTTLATLDAMGLALDRIDRDGEAWIVRAKNAGTEVSVELTAVSARLTRASARVERGTLSADKETATTLLAQIDLALKPAPPAVETVRGPDASGDLAALAGEIGRLRAIVDAARTRIVPAAPSSPPPIAVPVRDAIFSVPTSYGVPSVASPPAPAAVAIVPARLTPAVQTSQPLDPRAGALRPVEVLTPVAPLGDAPLVR